ncbi:hypothetical protein N9137_00720 [Pseudomonadales bacterium]|nr:hypothetical protein [Pseudomonadales bacterium]
MSNYEDLLKLKEIIRMSESAITSNELLQELRHVTGYQFVISNNTVLSAIDAVLLEYHKGEDLHEFYFTEENSERRYSALSIREAWQHALRDVVFSERVIAAPNVPKTRPLITGAKITPDHPDIQHVYESLRALGVFKPQKKAITYYDFGGVTTGCHYYMYEEEHIIFIGQSDRIMITIDGELTHGSLTLIRKYWGHLL